jgi:hypothetical protein
MQLVANRQIAFAQGSLSGSLNIVHLNILAILDSLTCFLITERDLADRWDRSDQERPFSSSVGIQQVDFITDMKFWALKMTLARFSKLLLY